MLIGVIESELTNFDSLQSYEVLTELIVGAGVVLFAHRVRTVSFSPRHDRGFYGGRSATTAHSRNYAQRIDE